MSRSRRSQCSVGRGCRVCGHAGAAVEARQADAVRVDERVGYELADAYEFEPYVCSAPPGTCEGCGDRHLPLDVVEDKPVLKVALGEIVSKDLCHR